MSQQDQGNENTYKSNFMLKTELNMYVKQDLQCNEAFTNYV